VFGNKYPRYMIIPSTLERDVIQRQTVSQRWLINVSGDVAL